MGVVVGSCGGGLVTDATDKWFVTCMGLQMVRQVVVSRETVDKKRDNYAFLDAWNVNRFTQNLVRSSQSRHPITTKRRLSFLQKPISDHMTIFP